MRLFHSPAPLVRLNAETVRLPFRPRHEAWSLLTLEASAPSATPHRPVDFVLLLDRSSSMRGAPLLAAIDAACAVIDALGPDDRFSVIAFDAEAELLFPLCELRSSMKQFLRARLERLTPGYGTHYEAALGLAAEVCLEASPRGAVRRVLMLTDGYPSIGADALPELRAPLSRLGVAGFSLSCAGVGAGFEPELLAALAQAGRGVLHALESAEAIPKLLRREIEGAQSALLSSVSVELEPDPRCEKLSVSHRIAGATLGRGVRLELGELDRARPRQVLFQSSASPRIGRLQVRGLDDTGQEAFFEERELLLGQAGPRAVSEVASCWLGLQLADGLAAAWRSLGHGRGAVIARLDAARALAHAVEAAVGCPPHPLARRVEETLQRLDAGLAADALRLRKADDLSDVHATRVSRVEPRERR